MIKSQKGFSLIEVLVTVVITSVLLASLYFSLSVGLKAHQKTEEYLSEERGREIFLLQFSRELRNSIPYSGAPFFADERSIRFPTRTGHYTRDGFEPALSTVEYKIERGKLVRVEKPLKAEGLRRTKLMKKEVLFDEISSFKVEFLKMTAEGEMQWSHEWQGKADSEIPRGVRISVAGGVFGDRGMVREIIVPHGVALRGQS